MDGGHEEVIGDGDSEEVGFIVDKILEMVGNEEVAAPDVEMDVVSDLDVDDLQLVHEMDDQHINEVEIVAELCDQGADEVEYVVEKILDKKIEGGIVKYLVKWEGYPSSLNTWEPLQNLVDCDKAMREYQEKRAMRLAAKYGDNKGPGERASNGTKCDKGPKEYEVDDIMGITIVDEEKYFVISLVGEPKNAFMRTSLANRMFPGKVVDFYLKHLKWKQK